MIWTWCPPEYRELGGSQSWRRGRESCGLYHELVLGFFGPAT